MGNDVNGRRLVVFKIILGVVVVLYAIMDVPSINIGAIMAFDTTSGKIARTAIELAVEDVNRNSSILNGTLLSIDIRDSTQDALAGASAAMGNDVNGGRAVAFQIILGVVVLLCAGSQGKMDVPSINIGAMMAFDTTSGKIARTAIELAVEDVNRNSSILNGTHLNIDIRDSTQDALAGASAALEMLRRGCVSIVGPQTSMVAEFVANLGSAAHVPIVTFAATNPALSMHRYPYFIRTAPSDTAQMTAIAKLIEYYRWRDVVLLYTDDDLGMGAIPALNDALSAVRRRIVYKASVSPHADASVLRKLIVDQLLRLETRVFVVHMHPDSALILFSEAYKLGATSSEYVWIITDGFVGLLDSFNASSLASMNGVLGVKRKMPQANQTRLEEFSARWKDRFRANNPGLQSLELNFHALVAYDTVWAIAMAIDQLLRVEFFNVNFSSAASTSTNFLNLPVFEGGNVLHRQILYTDFVGLSGHVRLNQKREPLEPSYDIVNVAGNGYKLIGSWSDSEGLNVSSEQVVNWGGGSKKAPRGWVIPAPGKLLKIAVPWDIGFSQFVSVKPVHPNANAQNQNYTISGFSIDVFKAVLRRLDYDLDYVLIPYGSGKATAGYYDELVYQVYLQKFDAVVGDVSVIANRSKYVDFTQPYTESALVMAVANRDEGSSDPLAFLHPFSPAMWITTVLFFVFTGATVWLLEHRRNRQFRGNPRKQFVTFIWFSFSTLFMTQSERIVSGLGRAVVIIWLFVVFVLVSSYTASLSAMFTRREIVPEVDSVEFLINKNLPIGYWQGSFIGNYLEQQLSVNKSMLRQYSSVQEYTTALSMGPNNGGVAAIFDEQSVVQNLFLATGCNAYTQVGPTYRTGGFAFVFPKGSLLVSDISKAILNLSASKEMQDIRNEWFKTNISKCSAESRGVHSSRLNSNNFWGLFLFTGCVSFLTLTYYLCRLLYRFMYRHEDSCHGKSITTRLRKFASYADQKDIPPPKRKRYEISFGAYETTVSLPPETTVS